MQKQKEDDACSSKILIRSVETGSGPDILRYQVPDLISRDIMVTFK